MSNPIDINKITNFISTYGSSNCYIGITVDILDRFISHGLVDSHGTKINSRVNWYWGDAETEQNARTIEDGFLRNYPNLKGDTGGGTNPHNVYVYMIIPGITKE